MEEATFGNEINSELTGINKDDAIKRRNLIIIGVSLGILVIVLIIIIISLTTKKKDNDTPSNENKELIGEINCIYDIDSTSTNTLILGNEFKQGNLDIYIDKNVIKFSKEYKFDSVGIHEIQIKLYEELNMDYMFKDVKNIISVEMISQKDCKITSMISTFENAKNFQNFTITGFNGDKLKSLKKVFYKSGLNEFHIPYDFTSNVEDMSYMFSSSLIEKFLFSSLNINKVKSISHMFEKCDSLIEIDFDNININNINDMSYLFFSCSSIQKIDF